MKNNNYQQTKKIKEVTEGEGWFSITTEDSMGCGMKKDYGFVPKVGDMLTVHTKGSEFGTIRGMDLNGIKVFWKTDDDLEADSQKWLREMEEKKQLEFIENKADLDKRYDALPECFRQRISKFRYNNERFRIDYESYEMLCCEQAVVIANACKTKEGIEAFRKMEWDEQKKAVPGLSDGHSGNTFGMSVRLAYLYLDNQEGLVKMHGAMAVLVGSEEYGCVPKK